MPAQRFNNRDVAELLDSVASRLQILGANRFRVLAFQNAAESIRSLGQDINRVFEAGKLDEIPGVGKGIAGALTELFESGKVAEFDQLADEVPAGVIEMMQVPDMGPKKAKRLWDELGIISVDELKAAAAAGELRELKGFGAKSEAKIIKGIDLLAQRGDDRTPIGDARPLALALIEGLRGALPAGAIRRITVAGSLRRWKETIGDVDILAISDDAAAVMEAFRTLPQVSDVVGSGDTKTSVILTTGLQVDLRVVEERHWGAALQYFTGSKEHNVPLRELAQRKGWSLNEYGLTATARNPQHPAGAEHFFAEEEDLYRFLGLEWVAPELRENRGEMQAAAAHTLPTLICRDHIRGELHGHSTWSDGVATIEEMASAALEQGYDYWCVSDHSIGLGIVQGVDEERLRRQAEEIAALNKRYAEEGLAFRLLHGVEVEVLADGELALPDHVLAALDVVVASIHSGLRQDRDTITARCLRAVRHPNVHVLGHPTGRLIGSRPPADLDMEQVLQACAEQGTVVEINAHPARLDLNDVLARRAVELGCKIAINTDAHAPQGMALLEYGLATGRRAWLQPDDVINTLDMVDLLAHLNGQARYSA